MPSNKGYVEAGKALRGNVLAVAGAMLQAKPEDLDIRNGIVVDKVKGTERLGLDDPSDLAEAWETPVRAVDTLAGAIHAAVPR